MSDVLNQMIILDLFLKTSLFSVRDVILYDEIRLAHLGLNKLWKIVPPLCYIYRKYGQGFQAARRWCDWLYQCTEPFVVLHMMAIHTRGTQTPTHFCDNAGHESSKDFLTKPDPARVCNSDIIHRV